ncbi:MAG: DUF309 domain-containing protein [Alicyclobacillaceae bacterium]|nr:DUF309 domain-containing protein [Alicyclobacillaceae bacterium]
MHEYPRQFVDFVYLFNVERNFYECHEYGEHLWLEEGRPPFLKGLIQVAVSLYHLEGGNLSGARKLWRTARTYLAPYSPTYMGLDIDAVLRDMDLLFGSERRSKAEPSAFGARSVHLKVVDPHLEERLRHWKVQPLAETDRHAAEHE